MKLSLGNERATRQGTAGDRVNDSSFAPAVPTERHRPKGTRVFWKCMWCHGKCSESRMVCTYCFRGRREAIA